MIKKVRDYGNREKEKELALIPMSQKDLTSGIMPKSTITYWQRWWTPYGWYNRPRTWKEISRETYMSLLSFRKVSETNLDRALVWHPKGLEEWSPLEWGGALAGEAGELCNILKKLKRLDTGLQQADNVTKSELLNKAGKEIADVYLYLDLIASRLGLDIAEEIVKKFNETSEKEGFPHRL